MRSNDVRKATFSREERIRRFGIDCNDELAWENGSWSAGGEFRRVLVLKNVGQDTVKLKYTPPSTAFFSMDFPEVMTLSPGISFEVPVVFRPVRMESYHDFMEVILSKNKLKWSFAIPVVAKMSKLSVSLPEIIDFGFSPVNLESQRIFEAVNTGQADLHFRWEVKAPFRIEPEQGMITDKRKFSVIFYPTSASALVSLALFHVEGLAGSPLQFKISGIGKFPFISLSDNKLEFGEQFPGQLMDKEVVLTNQTVVPAKFEIKCVESDLPGVFSIDPSRGTIPPECDQALNVKYIPTSAGQFTCDHFVINTPGGNSANLECTGTCVEPEVFSRKDVKKKRHTSENEGPKQPKNVIQFGECGIHSKAKHTRAIYLRNESTKPISFFFLVDPGGDFEFIGKNYGTIPACLETAITVRFRPRHVGNFYCRVFCAIENHKPLFFDFIGTSYDEKSKDKSKRPQPLTWRHVEAHRKRVLVGLERETPDYILQVLKERGEQELEQIQFPENDEHSCCSGFGTQGDQEILRQFFARQTEIDRMIVLDTEVLDFGEVNSLRGTTEKRTLKATNNHHAKVTCTWEMNCSLEDTAPFEVFPVSQDIGPGKSAEFRVHFRPGTENMYYSGSLSAFVHLKSNRTFRLVNEDAFVPPFFVSVDVFGNTFANEVEHFLPNVRVRTPTFSNEDSIESRGNSHILEFPVCHLGERAIQTCVVENKGDTPVFFRFANDESQRFDVKPRHGQIDPAGFTVLTFSSQPIKTGTNRFKMRCVLNNSSSYSHIFSLHSHCDIPQLEIEPELFIQPTCIGLSSCRPLRVKNTSRVPIAYKWKIPRRLRDLLSVSPEYGKLGGNETISALWTFRPSAYMKYNNMQAILVGNSIDSNSEHSKETKQNLIVHGEAVMSCLSFDRSSLYLGTILAKEVAYSSFYVVNSGDCEVKVDFQVENTSHPSDHQVLSLPGAETVLPARSKTYVKARFAPVEFGSFEFGIKCKCLQEDAQNSLGSISLSAIGTAETPQLTIEDARSRFTSTSRLWRQFNLQLLNSFLTDPVGIRDVEFTKTIGAQGLLEETKRNLWNSLDKVDFRFLPAPVGSEVQHVKVQLRNSGTLHTEFKLHFPNESDIDVEPWANSREPGEAEVKEAYLLGERVFQVSPRAGTLEAGEAMTVCFSYSHKSLEFRGLHQLEVVLSIKHGKQIRIALSGQTIAEEEPCLFPVSTRYELCTMALGLHEPPLQTVELVNPSNHDLHFVIDESQLQRLREANFDFPVLHCLNPEGKVAANGGKVELKFVFNPIEAIKYICDVDVKFCGNDIEDSVTIQIVGSGFHPLVQRNSEARPGGLQPVFQSLPYPGQMAVLSMDVVDFGTLQCDTESSRLIFMRNRSTSSLDFSWSSNNGTSNVQIVPQQGKIRPGHLQTFKLRLSPSLFQTEVINTDLECELSSLKSMLVSEEGSSGNELDEGEAQQHFSHISVVERSTITRDRRLKASGRAASTSEEDEVVSIEERHDIFDEPQVPETDVEDIVTQSLFCTVRAHIVGAKDAHLFKDTFSEGFKLHNDNINQPEDIRSKEDILCDAISRPDVEEELTKLCSKKVSVLEYLRVARKQFKERVNAESGLRGSETQQMIHRVVENTVSNLVEESVRGEINLKNHRLVLVPKEEDD